MVNPGPCYCRTPHSLPLLACPRAILHSEAANISEYLSLNHGQPCSAIQSGSLLSVTQILTLSLDILGLGLIPFQDHLQELSNTPFSFLEFPSSSAFIRSLFYTQHCTWSLLGHHPNLPPPCPPTIITAGALTETSHEQGWGICIPASSQPPEGGLCIILLHR